MTNFEKLWETAQSNTGFLAISTGIIAVLILGALLCEKLIAKKTGVPRKSEHLKVKRMAIIGVFSAIAVVLMIFKFPLPFVPSFYTIDFSELPVIIGTLALGPVAGLTIELIKIVGNLLIGGTSSAFVGEFANFIFGCAYVVPAAWIYFIKKSKKHAIAGLTVGTIVATIAGGFVNAFLLLPKYAQVFHMPIDALIGMGTEANASIQGMTTFILLGVVPFNIIKYGAVSIITILIYKQISTILKTDR